MSGAIVEVDTLRFGYDTDEVLKGISFGLGEGEIVGLLGPSGSGKSTTVNVLIGLLRGYRGACRLFGRELSEWTSADSSSLYEKIGVCFELPNHYLRLTARENLEHFARLYQGPTRAPEEVLDWVGLADSADVRTSDFSKGMKIRLNLARSFLHRPSLLFLDEPTSGLDPVTARTIMGRIETLRDEGASVLITTHDMAVADRLCDRVAFLSQGEIAAFDSPANLKKAHGERTVEVVVEAGTKARFALDGLGENEAFLKLLQSSRIETIHSLETTLEQVFVDVTGEVLRGDEGV